jgi:hypothetical protein
MQLFNRVGTKKLGIVQPSPFPTGLRLMYGRYVSNNCRDNPALPGKWRSPGWQSEAMETFFYRCRRIGFAQFAPRSGLNLDSECSHGRRPGTLWQIIQVTLYRGLSYKMKRSVKH